VQGASNGRIDIRLINQGVNPVKQGDVFVTSGSGGLYPPGIPVAVATEPHRDGATGHLAADPADNEFVIVEPAYSGEARALIEQIEKDGAKNAAGEP
jgi:rod shape-determining protein MreC